MTTSCKDSDHEVVCENEANETPSADTDMCEDVESVKEALPETLEAELETVKLELAEAQDKALRAAAETENVRKRSDKAVENAHKFALEGFVTNLLPVFDSFQKGVETARSSEHEKNQMQATVEGMELSLKLFSDILEKSGVKAIDPLGEPFNPDFHQAMTMVESNQSEPGSVIEVIAKGYSLNDRLVRPAMVIVAKEPKP